MHASRTLRKKFTVNGAIEPRRSSQFYFVHPLLDELIQATDAGEFFMLVGPRGSGKTTAGSFLLPHLQQTRGYIPLRLYLTLHSSATSDARTFWAGVSTSLHCSACEFGVEIIAFHDAAGFQAAFSATRWFGRSRFVLMIDEFNALKNLPSDVREQVLLHRVGSVSLCAYAL